MFEFFHSFFQRGCEREDRRDLFMFFDGGEFATNGTEKLND
jgi:hypothetical protein